MKDCVFDDLETTTTVYQIKEKVQDCVGNFFQLNYEARFEMSPRITRHIRKHG